jgi:hypothetical protein
MLSLRRFDKGSEGALGRLLYLRLGLFGLNHDQGHFNGRRLRRGFVDERFAGSLSYADRRRRFMSRRNRLLRLRRKSAQGLRQLLGLLRFSRLGSRLDRNRLRGWAGRRFAGDRRLVGHVFATKQALQKPWARARGFAVRLQVIQRLPLQAAQFTEQQRDLAGLAHTPFQLLGEGFQGPRDFTR